MYLHEPKTTTTTTKYSIHIHWRVNCAKSSSLWSAFFSIMEFHNAFTFQIDINFVCMMKQRRRRVKAFERLKIGTRNNKQIRCDQFKNHQSYEAFFVLHHRLDSDIYRIRSPCMAEHNHWMWPRNEMHQLPNINMIEMNQIEHTKSHEQIPRWKN